MRLIDADEITATLEIAISMMENTKSIIGVENLPVIDVEIKAYTDILKGIKEQPTVQPEKRTKERTETHACDLISRKDALDAVSALCDDCDSGYCGSCRVNYPGEKDVIKALNDLTSVQPVATDTNVGNNSEIPNSSDCISRQQEIDALDTAIEHYDGIAEECRKKADIERNDYMDMRDDAYEARQLAQWLNELKYLREKIEQLTIKPEPQWIPVSERLPYRCSCVVRIFSIRRL